MIPADTLKIIQDTAREAAETKYTPINSRQAIVSQNGSHEIIDIPPTDRHHQVDSIDTFIDAVKRYGESSSVWHNHRHLVCLVDDGDRRDTVTLSLEASDQLRVLVEINGKPIAQSSFIRLLKVDFDGCVPESLLPAIRQLEFNRSSTGRSSREHGSESLGRTVEAKVQGRTEIPEYVVVQIPIYGSRRIDRPEPVKLSLDIDTDNETFSLTPVSDSIRKAIDSAQSHINDILSDELKEMKDVSVFHGSPD